MTEESATSQYEKLEKGAKVYGKNELQRVGRQERGHDSQPHGWMLGGCDQRPLSRDSAKPKHLTKCHKHTQGDRYFQTGPNRGQDVEH
jgi:hypothetical protein